jgi:hypothetical protein
MFDGNGVGLAFPPCQAIANPSVNSMGILLIFNQNWVVFWLKPSVDI